MSNRKATMLIVESGASKADWVFVDHGESLYYLQTTGMNPVAGIKLDYIKKILNEQNVDYYLKSVPRVFFYGAGCKGEDQKNAIRAIFDRLCPLLERIEIESDIMAVGRGLCEMEQGNIGIIGTGSLAAVYNGESIIECTNSLGYLVNDEGSGYELGKEVIKVLQYGHNNKFENGRKKLNLPPINTLIPTLYNSAAPNKIIADYARILGHCPDEQDSINILSTILQRYFTWHYQKLENRYNNEMNFCGSIAFYYIDMLTQIAEKNECIVRHVMKSPLEGLIKFHHLQYM